MCQRKGKEGDEGKCDTMTGKGTPVDHNVSKSGKIGNNEGKHQSISSTREGDGGERSGGEN